MDVLECIRTRRTIRKFTEQPVEFGKLSKILEAGTLSPSAGNLQNWRFILVTEKPLIRQIYEHCMRQEAVYHAQAVIIVCSMDNKAEMMYGLRGKRLYSVQNCACAAENMLLAAHSLGLGACWIGAFDEDKIDSMFDMTYNQKDVRPQMIIALGYPAEKPRPPKRVDMASVVHFNQYALKAKYPHIVFRDYSVEWQKQAREIEESSEKLVKKFKKGAKKLWKKIEPKIKNFFESNKSKK
ncbi:MAG: nitroreductase family protein [Nanoarchaeota archaeon]|nr:nitroreductase family protein [Nanoarchaeota archaeon]